MAVFELYSAKSHYNTLQDLSVADEEFTKRQLHKLVDTDLRRCFVESGVQSVIGLTLLHRHFPLDEGEKLVNYGAVAYPWVTSTMAADVARDIVPLSWRFTGPASVAPYEFQYVTATPKGPGETVDPEKNPLEAADVQAFLARMGAFLHENGLAHLFGVQRLDTVLDAEQGLEFTAERANITLPLRASGPDVEGAVEALWVFDDAIVSRDPDGTGETTVYKKCRKMCVKKKTGHRKVHKGQAMEAAVL